MQLKILSTNSLLKSIAFLINYVLNSIFNVENMLKVISKLFEFVGNTQRCKFYFCCIYFKAQENRRFSARYPTRGFETYYGKIRLEGLLWKRKRVLRVYRNINLKLRVKAVVFSFIWHTS
ncbi:hypothetical protein J2772_000771 [Chryseobacterium jejuense]|nr:hypothetical protein [Chryseobacterium jejuense]